MSVRVFLLKDVEKVGIAGEIIKASEGYVRNFLVPHKLGVEITPANESSFANRIKVVEHRKEVVASQTSMLAEKVKSTEITLKKKMHDDGKLYGAVAPADIVEALAQKGIAVSKSQVEFDKAIKAKGTHEVTIKLSSKLKPAVKVKIVPEE